MAALEWTCHKEGMLRKSHRGAASILNPRYFVSDGFHVMYFESEAMKTRHGTQDSPRMRSAGRTCHPGCRRSPACMPPPAAGRFDLRNVQMLRPAADMYNAVEFVLSEGCPQHVEKCTPRGTEPHTLSAGREPRGWGAAAGAVGGTLSPWLIPLPPPGSTNGVHAPYGLLGTKSKSIIVSFQSDPTEKPKWLQLWCGPPRKPARPLPGGGSWSII